MKEQKSSFQTDKTYPDALTNLFVGIFAGNILYSIQKVHFFEIQKVDLKYILLLMNEFIYLVYLIYGYFTLFRIYHYDAVFFKKNYNNKKWIKYKFTSLAFVIGLLVILPHSFSTTAFIKFFYPTFCFILVFDIVWIYSYSKVLGDDSECSDIAKGYSFDTCGIFISLFAFTILLEWQEAEKLFGNKLFWLIAILIHMCYFLPFLSLYYKK